MSCSRPWPAPWPFLFVKVLYTIIWYGMINIRLNASLHMKKTLIVALLVVTYCVGCGGDNEKEILAVQHAVLQYTQLLAQGYATMNMTRIQGVATEEQALKVYNHMSALGEAKIRMESRLVDVEFLDIQVAESGSAKVKTREEWNYTHVNTGTEMPVQSSVKGLIYMLSYELVRSNGKWLVSSVSTLEEHNTPAMSK